MKAEMREAPQMRGTFEIKVIGPDGKVKDSRKVENLVVDAGVDFIADVMGAASQPTEMDNIGVGWGANASDDPTAGQTDLQGASKDRNTAVYAHTPGLATFTLQATWGTDDPSDGSVTIEESAVFNDSSGGTMLCRQTFAGVNKGASDTLEVTWTFTIS